ncbi:MAG: bifunctional folylpolyglutamate synthase/dihydrofolate synthase [Candidatus Hydrogenedentes bacterium]|nr:bifunctional folylpolyglutamate synthase/dihydrofolate synthase [Candidatus Hydrogenedentota bacterium]
MDITSDGLPHEDIEYLSSLVLHGIKLGLENIENLMELLGNPHLAFKSIHIAGTNGKGSVAAIVDRIFREEGYKVGKFTSPHLVDLRERFQINGIPISAEELHEEIRLIREVAEKKNITPTFFEFCTAIAFHWFAKCEVEWAVVEVGMGGRLDSTNVIHPEVCVITNIGLEHTQYLGKTLEQIASEKAGIIKNSIEVVSGETKVEPLEKIKQIAKEKGSRVWEIGKDFSIERKIIEGEVLINYAGKMLKLDSVELNLKASYQRENVGLALAVIDYLRGKDVNFKEENIVTALNNVRWPGRYDLVSEYPYFLLDCAHNPDGVKKLVEDIDKMTIVLSVADDKDIFSIVNILSPKANYFIATQFYGKRALPADKIGEVINSFDKRYLLEQDFFSAIEIGWERAKAGEKVLVTGSIYAVGQAFEWLIKNKIIDKIEF